MTDQPETDLESEIAQWQEWCSEACVRADKLQEAYEEMYSEMLRMKRERDGWKADAIRAIGQLMEGKSDE